MTPDQTARLDAHERDITSLTEGQRRLWQESSRTSQTTATIGAKVDGQGDDIREIKTELKDIKSGQVTLTRWMAAATFTGLGLILTLGLWLAERLS